MIDNSTLWDIWETGNFYGQNRPQTRVTVEPDWFLNLTGPVVGTSKQGPFRWFQRSDNSQQTIEIPNIKSVVIDRSLTNDAATCEIQIYNQWMLSNGDPNLLPDQLGQPGYFTPSRGSSMESARWNQTQNAWNNILIPDALIRVMQGYGGFDENNQPLSIDDCLTGGYLEQTGCFLVDSIQTDSKGMITLKCRDMGKLLIDQLLIPPLIPNSQYPTQFQRWVYTAINTPIKPRPPQSTVATTSFTGGKAPQYVLSGEDLWAGQYNASVHGHRGTDSTDGNPATYALSVGNMDPHASYAYDFFEYKVGGPINEIQVTPLWGGYQLFLSVMENGVWVNQGGVIPYDPSPLYGTQTVVNTGANVPYVLQCGVGWETPLTVTLPRVMNAEKVRVTFHNEALSPWGPYPYRCGIREILVRLNTGASGGAPNSEAGIPGITQLDVEPFVQAMAPYGPGEGYWIAVDDGTVYAFGDARTHPLASNSPQPVSNMIANKIAGTKSGQGYYVLQNSGRVLAYGDAVWYGDGQDSGNLDYIGFAVTNTGDGYYLLRREGTVEAYGDAIHYGDAPDDTIPGVNDAYYETFYRATAIATHPTQDGYWIVSGNGTVTAFGGLTNYGGLVQRKFTASDGRPAGALVAGSGAQDAEKSFDIKITPDGGGYWVLGGAFQVFPFGNAYFYGQGMAGVNQAVAPTIDPTVQTPATQYKGLCWSMAPDQAGDGYYILRGDGFVAAFGNAPLFGGVGSTGQQRSDGNYCVDDQTEILTKRGWLTHDKLFIGDETLALDPVTLESRWEPVLNVFRRDVINEPMLFMQSRDHSSVTTLDHKWLMKNSADKPIWRTSEDFAHGKGRYDKFLMAAPRQDMPTEKKYDDDFVELVAWFWTEGSYDWTSSNKATMSQSEDVYPENVKRIDDCLYRMYGNYGPLASRAINKNKALLAQYWHKLGVSYAEIARRLDVHVSTPARWMAIDATTVSAPKWNRAPKNSNGVIIYRFCSQVRDELLQVVSSPLKVVSPEFLTSLTLDQLLLFIDVSLMADGSINQKGTRVVPQREEERSKAFEMACVLAGLAPNTTKYTISEGNRPKNGNETYYSTTVRKTPHFSTYSWTDHHDPQRPSKGSREIGTYTGTIWCPTTASHTWLARRDGHIYFTGNCDMSDLIRLFLLWSGFWFQSDNPPADKPAQVFGNLETTGTYLNDPIDPATFDKKKIIDCITWVKQVVGFIARCDRQGGYRFEAANQWSVGNYLEDGTPYSFLPEIDELTTLIEFEEIWSDDTIRSQIVISTEMPDTAEFTTQTTILVPTTSQILRGITKPAIWSNGRFSDAGVQKIMAELVAMQIWFQQRTGTVTIPGQPCLDVDDQVRIYERTTGSSYVHYVSGIHSEHDLDAGTFTYQLTTNWLGDQDTWFITKDNIQGAQGDISSSNSGIYIQPGQQPQFRLSDDLVEWLKTHTQSPKLALAKINGFESPQASAMIRTTATTNAAPSPGAAPGAG